MKRQRKIWGLVEFFIFFHGFGYGCRDELTIRGFGGNYEMGLVVTQRGGN